MQSLRITLNKLEENFASPEDEPIIAELKRILMLRIADIEAVETLQEARTTEAVSAQTETMRVASRVEPAIGHSPESDTSTGKNITPSDSASIQTACACDGN
ncbi:hypothetical protein P8935_22950 [Telmatobacter sp. DSM 110680]|uniref:Uncharacterized protein n=1 Tax=Telmatobacter sp. DSM 110680 TaxID=3036704 RepID=A0AAU7DIE2_9BACT